MLSEHQLETIEKTFPEGCVTVWAIKKSDKKSDKAKRKFGVYVFNPKNNSDIEDVLRLIIGASE
jgi:hypothetical protein